MARERESLGSRSARTFSVLTIGRIVSLIVGILSIVIIARMLGPAIYGTFTLAFAFFLLVSSASNFGFGVYLTKRLSELEDRNDGQGFARVLGAGFVSAMAVGIFLTIFGMAISWYVSSLFQISGVDPFILILASTIVLASMMYGTADYALIGVGKNAAAATIEILENIVLLLASVILIHMGYGATGAIAGILISYVFAGVLGVHLTFRFAHRRMHVKVRWPDMKDIKEAFHFSLPIAVNNIFSNAVVSFATLFLGFFVVASEIGNYGIANRARTIIGVFYSTTAVTLLPTLTLALSRQGNNRGTKRFALIYNKTLTYSMIATIPIIAYIGVFATPLLYFSGLNAFGSAPLYLALIAFGTIINLIGIFAASLFAARNKTSKLFTYGAISTLVQLIALALLVPKWGVMGAIVAIFFVGSIVNNYLFVRGTRTALGLRTDYGKLLRAFMSNVALGLVFAIGFYSGNFAVQLLWGLATMVLVYPILLALFRALEKEDVRMMEKAFGKLPALQKFSNPFLSYFKILTSHLQ